jgi:hypothetical protein
MLIDAAFGEFCQGYIRLFFLGQGSLQQPPRFIQPTFGKKIEQQQATFKLQAAAQLKAWREAADKLRTAGKEFAAERQGEIDATVKRMEVDAATAEEKLQKLNQAGMQSWSALMGALGETRAAFDRANKAAQEAFKRAAP